MNPDLLKPEIQALVNDVDIKKKALDWTLWIRQVLFLKDAWYLLLEMEPEEDFREVEWYFVAELKDNLRNGYHVDTVIYNRNLKLMKIIPPLDTNAGRISLQFPFIFRQDIRCFISHEMNAIFSKMLKKEDVPEEKWRDKLLEKMDEFDLKYDIPEELGKIWGFIKDIEDNIKFSYDPLSEKFADRLKNALLGTWKPSINLEKLKKEKYKVKFMKADRVMKFEGMNIKLSGVRIFPNSFSVSMKIPEKNFCLKFFFRKADDELISPLIDGEYYIMPGLLSKLGIMQNQKITPYFGHKLTGDEIDIDQLVERIVIKDITNQVCFGFA